jgi:hypothetical protein
VKALVDNDVMLKGACYGLLPDLLDALPATGVGYGILGAARFVISNRIARATLSGNRVDAQNQIETFIADADAMEPTEAEQRLAAELEAAAQRRAQSLDAGESQLAAILVTRDDGRCLVTGDKRAIRVLELILDDVPELQGAIGKVHCLEQCAQELAESVGVDVVCNAICGELSIDKTLAICCSCAGGQASAESFARCLRSYIEDLRDEAPRILAT